MYVMAWGRVSNINLALKKLFFLLEKHFYLIEQSMRITKICVIVLGSEKKVQSNFKVEKCSQPDRGLEPLALRLKV